MDRITTGIALIRSTEAEKGQHIENAHNYQRLRNNVSLPNGVPPLPPWERAGERGDRPQLKRPRLPPIHRPRTPQRLRQPNGGGEDAQHGADQSCVV